MPQHEGLPAGWRPAALIWDLDGTLVDSAPDLAAALNALLAEHDVEAHPLEQVRLMIGNGVAKLVERGFRAAERPLTPAALDAMVQRFMEIYSNCATDQTRLRRGALQALKHAANLGLTQGVCTNKPEAVSRQILGALGVSSFFGSVIGGDSTPYKKPHARPVEVCLEQLGVAPDEALAIGDSKADVGAAHAARVRVCVVAGGYTAAPPETLGADLVVRSLEEVPGLLSA